MNYAFEFSLCLDTTRHSSGFAEAPLHPRQPLSLTLLLVIRDPFPILNTTLVGELRNSFHAAWF